MTTHETKHETKEKCTCGKECTCGEDGCTCGCGCGCGCAKKFVAKSAVTVGSAIIIAAAILMSRCPGKAGFEDYIKNNPKVIIDAVEAYYDAQEGGNKGRDAGESKNAQAEIDIAKIVKEIVADKTNYSLGNPKGKFVIVEFFDHNCGWCRKTNSEMAEAVKTAKNIRWIPIDTPIFGEKSELISRYVLAAGKQGKYAQMHHAVGELQQRDEKALIEAAKSLGLNVKKLQDDANGADIKKKLERNREFTRKLKINGVPMLIINGKIHGGALFGDALAEVVAESNK